ncbi:MAG: hypothetical protein HQL35_15850 [Alphaproteobacteria bacterium]|nr:hypothetical protein [Alphaproteobacteria bacterium]
MSDYLMRTRSLEELDELIEKDRRSALIVAETTFNQEVAIAAAKIREINQIATARIQADSQIASAKIASDAEITVAELLANTEQAIRRIRRNTVKSAQNTEITASMVVQIGETAKTEIINSSENAVEAIKLQAELAIQQITDNSQRAIKEIQEHSEHVVAHVNESAQIAANKIAQAKLQPRTPEETAQQGQEAAQFIMDAAANASETLATPVTHAVEAIHTQTEEALDVLRKVVLSVEQRILDTRDRALMHLDQIVSIKLE